MGKIQIDHTGSGSGITLSSDGTSLLLDGAAIGGAALELYAENPVSPTAPSATGDNAVAIGSGATSANTNGIAIGTSANAGSSAMALGPFTDASGSSSLAGAGGTSSGFSSIAIGGTSIASATSSMALGYGTDATGDFSTAVGRNAQARSSSANAFGRDAWAQGSQATAIGDSYASGADSFAAAISNNTATYGATGASSVAIGYLAIASGNYSTAIGRGNATGTSSVAIGGMQYGAASATGTASVCIGANYALSSPSASGPGSISLHDGSSTTSTAQNSIAIQGARTTIFGQFAYAGGEAGSTAQTSMYVLKRGTTDATPSVLVANRIIANASPSTTNQIILSNFSAYAFHGTIVARQQASQGTATAAWKIEGLIRREGGAGTTVLVNSATTVLDNTPAWGMALSADTTNGGLKIEVTGAAATNIRFVATINTSEVTY